MAWSSDRRRYRGLCCISYPSNTSPWFRTSLGRVKDPPRRARAPALDDLLGRARHRRAAHGESTRASVAAPGAEQVAVAPEHLDALRRHAELFADDLREGRLVALAHRRRARE